ncbi:MAG: esterase [Pseudonocardiales bacterium]|nr:esterase [Pseudonocardiales bacterium]
MGLLSSTTIVLFAFLAIAAPLTCLLVWNKLGPNRWVRFAARGFLLVLCQGLAVLVAGLILNRSYAFYTSWSELFGRAGLTSVAAPAGARSADSTYAAQFRQSFYARHGTVIPWVIPAPNTGLPPQHALVYLPAAYGDPAAAAARYPVVQLFDGIPGNPETWVRSMQLRRVLDRVIASMQSVPFIAVMPTQNVRAPHDTQCLNIVHGPQIDTYLTVDVHRNIVSNFRVATAASGWATMGYSTGGYCALNLAMRHTDLYSAAVSMSGYGRIVSTNPAREFFGGNRRLVDLNTPVWEASHWGRKPLSILAIASRPDPLSYHDTVALAALSHGSLRMSTVLLAHGGHNATLWVAMEPIAFNWLSQRLVAPLAGVSIQADLLPAPPVSKRVPVSKHGPVGRAERRGPR